LLKKEKRKAHRADTTGTSEALEEKEVAEARGMWSIGASCGKRQYCKYLSILAE